MTDKPCEKCGRNCWIDPGVDMTFLPCDCKDFLIGTKVQKIKGYKLPGVVVSVFKNLKGDLRYVVECTVPEVAGLLHIYSAKDLEKTK